MRPSVIGLFACVLAASLAAGAVAGELNVGDKAPPLTVSKFVKGEPVSELEPGQIYVVEFWATWCGPCRTSIPHLTKLQKEHEDVKFIGVSIWENDTAAVEPFVKEMGDKMDYRVAMDDLEGNPKGKMAENWMAAAGENGIPSAFIVDKEGKVAWIGHPMTMDKPLAQIVEGRWDVEAYAGARRAEKAAAAKLNQLSRALNQALRQGPAEALKVIDEAIAEEPALEDRLAMTRFSLLIQSGQTDRAVEAADRLIEKYGENAQALNAIAWGLIDPARQPNPSKELVGVALRAAERANEVSGGEDAPILDTLALAYFKSGEKAKAVATQKKAVEQAEHGSLPAEMVRDIKQRLEEFQKAAEEGEK